MGSRKNSDDKSLSRLLAQEICSRWPDPRALPLSSTMLFRPACRAASKKASQQRWLAKLAENQDYFRGPQHVRRFVQVWRVARQSS